MVHPQVLLADLHGKFKTFRSTHKSRTKIPISLRQEVLLALESGISMGEITRVLTISSSQIEAWRENARKFKSPTPQSQDPRILNVTQETPPSGLRVSYEAGKWLLEISF